MSSLDNMQKRNGYWGVVKRVDENREEVTTGKGKYKQITRVHDQWTRMREDKLRSLRHALYYSYQAAVVQKYDVGADSEARWLISVATRMEKYATLSPTEKAAVATEAAAAEEKYPELAELTRYSTEYIKALQDIASAQTEASPYFRCLINHDKLKVDYEDKIISIPFEENSVEIDPVLDNDDWLQTEFHNGTVFKWVHGNKEEWTPDTYWIVYMQYSEETAYFRAEIRKADQEIEIIVIDDDGNAQTKVYRGWMTGPNETTTLWNVKHGIVWNDLNYTKQLYITKDEDTAVFFERFDRVIINGQPWEIQAYNENYGTNSSNPNTGIIRVALKETYTKTDEILKGRQQAQAERAEASEAAIIGPSEVAPYDLGIYTIENASEGQWEVAASANSTKTIDELVKYNIDDDNKLHIEVVIGKSYKTGFDIKYGDLIKHVVIKSL